MKVLQINTVYKVGSTGKIVHEIHSQLPRLGYESFVIYGRGNASNEPNVYKTSPDWEGKLQALYARFSGDFYGGAWYSTYKLIKKIKEISPNIVHVHLLNGNYVHNSKLLNFLAKNNYKTIITLHAEVNYTGICEHAFDCDRWKSGCGKCPQVYKKYHSWFFDKTATEWKRKAKAYAKFEKLTLVSVSSWLQKRAQQSPMFKNRDFQVVGNGVNTQIYQPVDANKLKKQLNLTDEKVILHVTPSFRSAVKGGEHVIEIAKRLQEENVKIVIVGFDGFDGPLPSNVITIHHTQSQQELVHYYSLADVTLITSKMETFSMVCAESLSCGTPVVGFKAGAPEQIAIPEYSEFVENGNLEALEITVKQWLNKKIDPKLVVDLVNDKYSTITMIAKYIDAYKTL